MRRLAVAIAALTWLWSGGCRPRQAAEAAPAVEDAPLVSVVNVADPRAGPQLISGFYGVEQDAWRWTMKKFGVTLRPPARAAQNGATLEVKLNVPQALLDRVGAVSLRAAVRGVALAPETFSKSGGASYAREVPASALAGDEVPIQFDADKALPPEGQDRRELALIVTTIGLLPK